MKEGGWVWVCASRGAGAPHCTRAGNVTTTCIWVHTAGAWGAGTPQLG